MTKAIFWLIAERNMLSNSTAPVRTIPFHRIQVKPKMKRPAAVTDGDSLFRDRSTRDVFRH
jgi:hypothetical protein